MHTVPWEWVQLLLSASLGALQAVLLSPACPWPQVLLGEG